MTMFGREHLHQPPGAPFTPEMAAATPQALGDWQGSRVDDLGRGPWAHPPRDALRRDGVRGADSLALLRSLDATPLYVVLLDEYERWTGDRKPVRDLEFEARAALN